MVVELTFFIPTTDSRFNRFHGSSQTGLFQEFLLRANKYNRLQMSGEKTSEDRKIILIEVLHRPIPSDRQSDNLYIIQYTFFNKINDPFLILIHLRNFQTNSLDNQGVCTIYLGKCDYFTTVRVIVSEEYLRSKK